MVSYPIDPSDAWMYGTIRHIITLYSLFIDITFSVKSTFGVLNLLKKYIIGISLLKPNLCQKW